MTRGQSKPGPSGQCGTKTKRFLKKSHCEFVHPCQSTSSQREWEPPNHLPPRQCPLVDQPKCFEVQRKKLLQTMNKCKFAFLSRLDCRTFCDFYLSRVSSCRDHQLVKTQLNLENLYSQTMGTTSISR